MISGILYLKFENLITLELNAHCIGKMLSTNQIAPFRPGFLEAEVYGALCAGVSWARAQAIL